MGQNYRWINTYGTNTYTTSVPGEICTDQNRDIYTIGAFMGSGDFNPTKSTYTMTSAGIHDISLVKMDENGDFRWAKKFGSDQDDFGYSLDIDSGRNLLFAGSFQDTCDFDYRKSIAYNLYSFGASDAFVVKLDTNGQFIWARQIGGTGMDVAEVVRCDSKGCVYVGGYFTGKTDFDPGPNNHFVTSAGSNDGFLLKLDPDGNFLWVINFPSTVNAELRKISISPDNEIYATGLYKGSMSINTSAGNSEIRSTGEFDIFISKIRENGQVIWLKTVGGPNTEEAFDICHYKNEIAICGYFNDSVDLDPGQGKKFFSTNGGHDVFVAKFTANGDYKWAESLGGLGTDEAKSAKYNSRGELYISGSYQNDPDFNPEIPENKLLPGWGTGFFLQKIDATDHFSGVISAKGGYLISNSYLAIDKMDNIIATGLQYSKSADFDPGPGKSDSILYQCFFNVKYTDPNLNSRIKNKNPTVTIFPNPAAKLCSVSGLSSDKTYQYSIYNATFQKISSGSISTLNHQIIIPDLYPGLVYLKVDNFPFIPLYIRSD